MTPAERLRKHQRSLEKTQRELDRERVKLENQEKKLVAEIRKSAKNGEFWGGFLGVEGGRPRMSLGEFG